MQNTNPKKPLTPKKVFIKKSLLDTVLMDLLPNNIPTPIPTETNSQTTQNQEPTPKPQTNNK